MRPHALLVLSALSAFTATAHAQSDTEPTSSLPEEDRKKLSLGLTLMVTAEPTDEGADVGINAVPVVVEWAAFPRLGVRVRTLLNAQVSGADTGLAQRGAGLTLPIYLSLPEAPNSGWYVGPYAAYSINPLVDGEDLTLAAEGGVRWALTADWSLNLAAQVGASHLTGNNDPRWVNHIGLYPSIGYWLL